MLQLGDKKISELYLGEKKVSEVYLWEKKIRPVGMNKWEVNSDTRVYLPLKTDKNDHSGNNRTIQSFLSVANNRAYVFWNQYALLTSFSELYFTLHTRIRLRQLRGYQIWFRYSDGMGNDISRCYLTWYGTVRININNASYDTWYIAKDDKEYLYSIIITQDKVSFYVDWEKKFEQAISWVQKINNAQMCLFNRFYSPNEGIKGTVRDVIIETKRWSENEIQNYYNQLFPITYTPRETTLAYYPFIDNKEDKTKKTSLLGQNWNEGELWWSFNSRVIYTPKVNAKFVSYWIKPSVVNISTFLSVWGIEEWYMRYLIGHPDVNGYANAIQTFDGTNWYSTKINLEENKWYHLAYGNDGAKTVVYVNGEQKIIRNWPPAPYSWYEPILTQASAEFVDFILESKARTPEEVQAYYNQTKWQFWL